jgi:hypothetical protein
MLGVLEYERVENDTTSIIDNIERKDPNTSVNIGEKRIRLTALSLVPRGIANILVK